MIRNKKGTCRPGALLSEKIINLLIEYGIYSDWKTHDSENDSLENVSKNKWHNNDDQGADKDIPDPVLLRSLFHYRYAFIKKINRIKSGNGEYAQGR